MRDGCPFCDYDGPSAVVKRGMVAIYNAAGDPHDYHYIVVEPLNPVTPGHLIVIPREHVDDFRLNEWQLGAAMVAASIVAADTAADEIVEGEPKPGCNLIVSAGAEATQTVGHVHVHVVPRRAGDGLKLPWSA